MAFLQRMISLMVTSLIILYTIPSTTSLVPDQITMILIDNVCVYTVHMYNCEQSIINSLDKPHAELLTIARIAAFNALATSKTTITSIRDDFLPRADNPLAKAQLNTCLAAYNGVAKYLEGAYRAVIENRYAEMRRYQSYVLPLFDQCKTDFDAMVHKNYLAKLMINISNVAAGKL